MIVAFLFLLASTRNYILSFLAILAISFVMATLFATINLAGWGLGIAESIGVVVFIGFSIDFIVHICHHYTDNHYDDR